MAGREDFDQKSATFLNWFKALPGAKFHPDLKLADLRNRHAGRGIIATRDIPSDTDLFSIPRTDIITVENSDLYKQLPDLFKSDPNEANDDDLDNDIEDPSHADLPRPWLNLILTLIYEYLHGPTSRWSAYLSILPDKHSFNSLMFWTEPELAHLQASAIRRKIGKSDADSIFAAHVLPVVKAHPAVFYPPDTPQLTDDQLLQLAHRMGSIIMAYAFDLEPEGDSDDEDEEGDGWTEDRGPGGGALGMVVMADMLNADAAFNAHLSHGDDRLTMTSIRAIREGEEVLNYYGPLANAELLRRYGYTSGLHARYDVAEVEWEVVRRAITEVFREFGYAETDIERALVGRDETFVFEREAGDPNDEGVNLSEAKVVAFPEELVEVCDEVVTEVVGDAVSGDGKDGQRLVKQWVLAIAKRVVETQLKNYETSVEEDEEILHRDDTSGRFRMAVDVRLGEKKLLREVLEYADKMIGKYGLPVVEQNGQPPTKKQKRGK